jgi:hypothetical protein
MIPVSRYRIQRQSENRPYSPPIASIGLPRQAAQTRLAIPRVPHRNAVAAPNASHFNAAGHFGASQLTIHLTPNLSVTIPNASAQ